MKQLLRLFLFMVTVTTSFAAYATEHQSLADPDGRFVLEYPSSWKPLWGLQTVNFSHPENKEVDIRIRAFPRNREDSRTPEEYVAETIKSVGLYGGYLDRKGVITVSGRDATSLEFVEDHGRWGSASGVDIIVPDGPQYYVVSLFGKGTDVAIVRAEFDRIVSSLRLRQAPQALLEWSGTFDGPQEVTRMVARTPAELRSMIGIFGRDMVGTVIPDSGFDFSAYMLVAISMGQKPTGGYWVKINDVIRRDDVLSVRYREHIPGQNEYVTQALTAPFHIKVFPRSEGGTVLFEREAEFFPMTK